MADLVALFIECVDGNIPYDTINNTTIVALFIECVDGNINGVN